MNAAHDVRNMPVMYACADYSNAQEMLLMHNPYTIHQETLQGLAARLPGTHAAPISHATSKMFISSLQTSELIVQRQHSIAQDTAAYLSCCSLACCSALSCCSRACLAADSACCAFLASLRTHLACSASCLCTCLLACLTARLSFWAGALCQSMTCQACCISVDPNHPKWCKLV